jgi:hypothetical protein
MDATTFFGRRGPFASAIPLWNMGRALREGVSAEGTEAWLRKLVSAYLRWYYARPRREQALEHETEEHAAHRVVQRACIRSALMGGTTGAFTTLGSIAVAESHGTLGFVAVPAVTAALGVPVRPPPSGGPIDIL